MSAWLAATLFLAVAAAGFAIGHRAWVTEPAGRAGECWIALWRSGASAEFRAVLGRGAERVIVARSPVFAAPATGPIPNDGPARDAHAELLADLRGPGWEPVGSEVDAWHRLRFQEADRIPLASAQ